MLTGWVIIFWGIAKCCCQNKLLNCCLRQQIHISEFIFKLEIYFFSFPSIAFTYPFDMGSSNIQHRLLKLMWSLFYTWSLWIKPSVCLRSFKCSIYLYIWHQVWLCLEASWKGREVEWCSYVNFFSSPCIRKYCVLLHTSGIFASEVCMSEFG